MKLTVVVYRRPNMFAVHDNMYNLMGYQELKNLFTIENYKTEHKSVVWYYPERFLNILEERALVKRAEEAGYEEVIIVTQSVYILQCVDDKCIRIVQDEEIKEDTARFKLSNDYSGLPDDCGLNILSGYL